MLPALLRLEDHARRDIILATPYFIPYEFEIERMQAFTDQGGELRILTNSLASNNQATVHGGYAKQRKKVAKAGVQLFEVRSDANRRAEFTSAPADLESVYGLHGKIGVFDDDRVFLGTFNLDPRSAGLNTEMGLLIESPRLNQQIRETLERDLLGSNSWKVIVGETGSLQWETEDEGQVSRRHSEPPAPLSKRLQAGLSRLLPIKGEL